MPGNYVLGGGMTGIAVAHATGWPLFEAKSYTGGLCATYEIGGFRFEPGGGHWLFRLGERSRQFLESHGNLRRYKRRASVRFPDGSLVPYPIQHHADQVPECGIEGHCSLGTMKCWLLDKFGNKLCGAFFWPFNEAYTCGLYDRIQPQDAYKNPSSGKGYNDEFAYPVGGLGPLLNNAAESLDIRCAKRVVRLDLDVMEIVFDDGKHLPYERIACTLPLDKVAWMAGLSAGDPSTSVTVLNIGAKPGAKMPDDHWVYVVGEPFYRVGFYSNVDSGFAPNGRVALYVEACGQVSQREVVNRLQEWGWIGRVFVLDESCVSPAYTWRWVGSGWVENTVDKLTARGVHMSGRYGRWRFQGIAESLEEGLGFRAN